jgi:hypothetical protein
MRKRREARVNCRRQPGSATSHVAASVNTLPPKLERLSQHLNPLESEVFVIDRRSR